MTQQPKVVSFYSFKGGAGRTLCTVNVTRHLAKRLGATERNPILLMDMDLDSAGLTLLMEHYDTFEGSPWNTSKMVTGELNLNIIKVSEAFFSEGMVDLSARMGMAEKTVRFVGAEAVGRESAVPVLGDAIEWMQFLLEDCGKRGVVSVVIDSASGRQDSALLCHSISDVVVYCCRITDQFLIGTGLQLEFLIEKTLAEGERVPNIILLPVAVPNATEKWQSERYKGCMLQLAGLVHKFEQKAHIQLIKEGIGEVEAFKWIESILLEDEALPADQQAALRAYESLAGAIADLFSGRN